MKAIDYIVLVLVIIGAINWGLVGFFGLDLVAFLFGSMSVLSRIIYAVIGICGLYAISFCAVSYTHLDVYKRQVSVPVVFQTFFVVLDRIIHPPVTDA